MAARDLEANSFWTRIPLPPFPSLLRKTIFLKKKWMPHAPHQIHLPFSVLLPRLVSLPPYTTIVADLLSEAAIALVKSHER